MPAVAEPPVCPVPALICAAIWSSVSLLDVVVKVATFVLPEFTLMTCPRARSPLVISLGFSVPPVLAVFGSTPTEMMPPLI